MLTKQKFIDNYINNAMLKGRDHYETLTLIDVISGIKDVAFWLELVNGKNSVPFIFLNKGIVIDMAETIIFQLRADLRSNPSSAGQDFIDDGLQFKMSL